MSEQNVLHTLILENRSTLNLSGVKEVSGCTDTSAVIFTVMGIMSLKGTGLRIIKYDVESGDLIINGKINSIIYTDRVGKKATTLADKLFK